METENDDLAWFMDAWMEYTDVEGYSYELPAKWRGSIAVLLAAGMDKGEVKRAVRKTFQRSAPTIPFDYMMAIALSYYGTVILQQPRVPIPPTLVGEPAPEPTPEERAAAKKRRKRIRHNANLRRRRVSSELAAIGPFVVNTATDVVHRSDCPTLVKTLFYVGDRFQPADPSHHYEGACYCLGRAA